MDYPPQFCICFLPTRYFAPRAEDHSEITEKRWRHGAGRQRGHAIGIGKAGRNPGDIAKSRSYAVVPAGSV